MKNNIKELRASIAISQSDLAKSLNVSRQTINSIENGKFDPSLTLALKLMKYFNKPLDSIFKHEDSL